MKLTAAELRQEDTFLRLYITTDAGTYLVPVAKPTQLAQGYTDAPDLWPHQLKTVVLAKELTEDSDLTTMEGITDPRVVALAITALTGPALERELSIPTEASALDTIKDFARQQVKTLA